ncbi:MAG: hypothetical protein JKY80_08540 [Mariprofundaceae bacterium]|nr:hypothetical protein [Mariprofundaceae bacterium]
MIDKRNVSFWYITIILILIISGLVWFSYIKAKETAEAIVGVSQENYQLSNVVLWTDFITEEGTFLWIFEFSNPSIIDDKP